MHSIPRAAVMFRRRRKLRAAIDDTGEAAVIRDQARADLRNIASQRSAIDQVTHRLRVRREQNHFGEDIQVTFKPRGGAT